VPIYEFECSACSHIFERFMKVGEDYDEQACPKCGALRPNKRVAGCRFHSRERFQERLARKMSNPSQIKR